MHVAINGWFWDQPWTGSGQYLRNLVTALTKLKVDLDITLVLPSHSKNLKDIPDSVEVIHASTLIGGKIGKVWFEQRGFPSAAKKVGADIAHVPYWGAPLSSSARLIVSVLDVIPLAIPQYNQGFFTQLYTSLVATSAKGAGHILTLSEKSREDITQFLEIPAEKITATYLATSDDFSPLPDPELDEAVREKYDLPDEFVLYFGGFDLRKNVNTLLLSWTYVGQPMGENIPLVLAGKEPDWGSPLFPDLKEYSEELNIDRYLYWLGEVDEEDKPSIYRLAKVFVFPSLYEGFGLPPLEAMASGTPVVAGNASSVPEVVGEAAYLVDPKNAKDMGGAILALLVQDDLHNMMSNAGRGQATNFSWRKTAQETYDIYQHVMNQ